MICATLRGLVSHIGASTDVMLHTSKTYSCFKMAAIEPHAGQYTTVQVGSVLLQGRLPVKNYDQYGMDADEDEGVALPPPPKDGNVSGKPRTFLQYAPSWAKHPDYDRV